MAIGDEGGVVFGGVHDPSTLADGVRAIVGRRWLWPLTVIVLGSVIVVLMLAATAEPDVLRTGIVMALAAGWLLRLVHVAWTHPASTSQALLRSSLFRGWVDGRATGSGIELRAELAEAHTRWEAYSHHQIRQDLVLLHESKQAALVLPRSFFADDATWAAFCDLVRRRVPVAVAR